MSFQSASVLALKSQRYYIYIIITVYHYNTGVLFTLCPSAYFVLVLLPAPLCPPQSVTWEETHPSRGFDAVPLCPACRYMPGCPGLWDSETALSPQPSGYATFPDSIQFELHFAFPSGALYVVLLSFMVHFHLLSNAGMCCSNRL